MSDVEITQDFYSHHNPLNFNEEKLARLKKKYGKTLHWDRRETSRQKGWEGHRPVKIDKDDEFYKDVAECLAQKQYEIDLDSEDGMVHQGDLVLTSLPVELSEYKAARRLALSNRGASSRDNLEGELSRVGNQKDVSVSEDMSYFKESKPEKPKNPVITAEIAEKLSKK